jgi:uncharacterized protein YbjT (DUF2867 family)
MLQELTSLRRWLIFVLLILATGIASATDKTTILVCGATGRQGNAVIDEILARGYLVRGMTRKPDGKKARALAAKGIEVVQGDYSDTESLRHAMEGVYGVFYYSGFSRNELAEGINVIETANSAGIEHLVYSSGAAASPQDGMQGATKMQIELKLRDSGVPFSVIRPVAFMENYRGQQARIREKGIIDSRAPERMVYFIAIRDIGFFAAEAFDNPDDWLGRGIDIAGDQMTLAELAITFGNVMGQKIDYHRLPLDEYLETFPKPMRPLFRWYDEAGYKIDTASLRKEYPNLITLDQYLRQTGWEMVPVYRF